MRRHVMSQDYTDPRPDDLPTQTQWAGNVVPFVPSVKGPAICMVISRPRSKIRFVFLVACQITLCSSRCMAGVQLWSPVSQLRATAYSIPFCSSQQTPVQLHVARLMHSTEFSMLLISRNHCIIHYLVSISKKTVSALLSS